ncbi:MAG TPA: response regulator transcription factor [Burkholderiales bacterium]|nr:response regulator transcription factor [Burkholderiales bacterium]
MSATAAPISVMLVDDHRSVLWGLEKLIDGEKPRMRVVNTATCTAEALSGARQHSPDVILLDLDLGGESGMTLIAKLRAFCDAKVVILTGMKNTEVREQAMVEGAAGVVLKSEPAQVILNAIERVHSGELWLDRNTTARVFATLARRNGARSQPQPEDLLTTSERRVVAVVVRHKGAPNKVIADALHISGHTLRNHLASIYGKLGIHRRLELVLYAMEHGLIQRDD